MQLRCYFCDTELEERSHSFKIGFREEYVCEKCYVKTINRRKMKNSD